jgi:hypothetical protein
VTAALSVDSRGRVAQFFVKFGEVDVWPFVWFVVDILVDDDVDRREAGQQHSGKAVVPVDDLEAAGYVSTAT